MTRGRATSKGESRRVAVVTYAGAQTLDVTGPLEVFATATRCLHERRPDQAPAYSIEILADRAGPVTMGSGIRLMADRSYRSVRGGIDTLIVCGGNARAASEDQTLLRWLRQMEPKVPRLASVCTGAFILAAAGLLDGRRATTHWRSANALSREYPNVTVEPDAIFVRDGHIYTSAGVTAGMDLALALVEEDFGRDVALMVARLLVLFLKRPGGQSQFSSQLAVQMLPAGPLKGLPEWIVEHLGEDLSVERLAARVAMSPRNFARVFLKETRTTPAKFVERARIDRARRELEDSTVPVETVAVSCGFCNAERMRRTFQRHLRVVPQEYRRRFENAA
jgi:transcriptional regulator GlxA family with amidase domain